MTLIILWIFGTFLACRRYCPPGEKKSYFKLTIPRGLAGKVWQCPDERNYDKFMPGPRGLADSFIECLLDFIRVFLDSKFPYIKSCCSHPSF
jgi:hypothetical protein